MKYLYVILTFLLTSCYTSQRFPYDPSYQTTTVVTAYTQPRPFGWGFRPSYWWQPRPYNPYYYRPTYVHPRPKHQFQQYNGNSGPRGGRRK